MRSNAGTNPTTTHVEFELNDAQAFALAQLVKRICWSDVHSNAVDDNETYLMIEALEVLRRGLADAGWHPR